MASKNYVTIDQRARTPRLCLGCKRPVVYGDRCPSCQQRLRLRRKRKRKPR